MVHKHIITDWQQSLLILAQSSTHYYSIIHLGLCWQPSQKKLVKYKQRSRTGRWQFPGNAWFHSNMTETRWNGHDIPWDTAGLQLFKPGSYEQIVLVCEFGPSTYVIVFTRNIIQIQVQMIKWLRSHVPFFYQDVIIIFYLDVFGSNGLQVFSLS